MNVPKRITWKAGLAALISMGAVVIGATAGSLTPPGAVGSTMHSLANIYDSIASATFDSSGIVANQNGSLLGSLKYIENQMAWASGSNNVWSLTSGNVGVGTTSPIAQFQVAGKIPSAAVGSVTISPNLALYTAIQGKYLYVATTNSATNNFQVIDISDPANPAVVGTLNTAFSELAVAVSGRYAYVTTNNGSGSPQLIVIDISNPTHPAMVSSTTITGIPIRIAVQGRYAYVVDNTGQTLQIYDVTNPAAPVLVSSTSTGAASGDLSVQGVYAYIANGTSLYVYNISNPAAPILVATPAITAGSVFVQGRYAYVGGTTLQVVDIKDPASPTVVGTSAHATSNMTVQGRYLYFTTTGNKVGVTDISSPASPSFVGSFSTTVNPLTLSVQGRYAYVGRTLPSRDIAVFDLGGSYMQQVESGGLETSTLAVLSNAAISNNLAVGGGGIFGRGLMVTGPVSFTSSISGYNSFVFNANGNVGIGTMSPTTKLEIVGTASASRFFAADGSISSPSFAFASTPDMGIFLSGTTMVLQNKDATPDLAGRSRLSLGEEFFSLSATRTEDAAQNGTLQCFDQGGPVPICTFTLTDGTNLSTTNFFPTYTSFDHGVSISANLEIGTGGDIDLASSGAAYRISGNKVLWIKSPSSNSDTMVGVGAGASLTTGLANTFIGYLAGNIATSSSNNTFIGNNAGQLNRTGNSNLFVGRQAGVNNTYGSNNVFLGGFNAGANNTTGSNNVFIGQIAGQSNTTGLNNTFIGAQAGQASTTGFDNTALGVFAGQTIGNGNQNTYIGTHAGRNATGNLNTFIGGITGLAFSTGGANTLLGFGADTTSATASGSVAIGYLAKITASHQLVFGSGTASGSLTDAYFGQGVASVSPAGITFNATGGSGTDNPGAPLRIAGGKGTGAGLGGSLIFQTAPASVSGSTLNSLVTRMLIDTNGNVGIGTISPTTKLQIVGNASASGNFEISSLASVSTLQVNQPPVATGSFVGTLSTFYAPVAKISKTYTTLPTSQAVPLVVQGIWNPTSGTVGMAAGAFYTQIAAGNALSPNGTMKGVTGVSEALGTGTSIQQLVGGYFTTGARNTGGAIVQANGTVSTVTMNGAKALTLANPVFATGNISNSGAVTNFVNVLTNFPVIGTGGTIGNYVGVGIDEVSGAASGSIGLFLASSSIASTTLLPTGNFSLFNASARTSYFAGNIGIGTKHVDAKLELVSAATTTNVASISALSLTSGDVFSIVVPASTSTSGRYLLIQDINGQAYASLGNGGRMALRRDITSHGAQAGCLGANNPSSGCIDYAESYPTTDGTLAAGEIVSVDPHNPSGVIRASNSASVLGIISTNPAALITGTALLSGASTISPVGTVPVALAGRVPVKLKGSVSAGDRLSLSDIPGVAQKASTAGMTIGIALEDSSGPTVLTFVNTSYWAPSIPTLPDAPQPDGLFATIINWFKNILGIEFGQGSVKVQTLCVGSVCVTEDQFMKVFGAGSGSASATPTPMPTESVSPVAEPSPDATSSPEVTPANTVTQEPPASATPTPTLEATPDPVAGSTDEPVPTNSP